MSDIDDLMRPGGIVPVDIETTAALVRNVLRLRKALEEIVRVGGQDLCRGIASEALRGVATGANEQ